MPSVFLRTLAIAVTFALFALAAPAADDFYELQLQTGKIDFAAGRIVAASDEFRIAAFGFLDRPPLLAEALARLALAQSSLGQTSLVTQTLGRFVDVEGRFNAYGSSALEDASRSKFQALLIASVPAETLKGVPSLAKLVKTPIEAAADLPMHQRIAAYESGFKREPRNVEWPAALMRLYATAGDEGGLARWSRAVLDLDRRNVEARALLVHAEALRGNCREALAAFGGFAVADLQSRNEMFADQGVCLVETGKFAEAKEAFARLSEQGKGRADVKKAMQKIADHDAAAAEKEPPKPASSAASTKPAKETPLKTTAKPTAKTATPIASPAASRPGGAPNASSPTAAPAPSKAPTSAETLTASRALVQSAKYAEAEKLLRTAVQSDPANRQLRLSLLEAAVLTRDWKTAGAQFAASQPYVTGEELYMFYAAVALHENGRRDEARPLMERARPRMVSSPMVDYYLEAILGTSD